MKKVMKKIYAIVLTILMLFNYMPAIVNAVDFDYYAIVELVSTATKYEVGDTILVDMILKEAHNLGAIKEFYAFLEYDTTALELTEEKILEPDRADYDVGIIGKSIEVTNIYTPSIVEGDKICTFKFKALKSSETSTTIKVYNLDITETTGNDPIYEDEGTVNEPTITLPVIPDSVTHNLKITKTDAEGTAIENNSALFKIVDLNGEVIYKETEADGSIALSDLAMPTTEGPYVYTIQELIAPQGYVVNNEELPLTVTFADDGTITAATLGTASANIVTDTNTIEVNISNELEPVRPEQEEFNLILNKVDEEGNSITTDTAEFTISMPDGTKENIATNVSTGKTNAITVTAPEAAGTYTYVINETKAPSGYILQENSIIVELTYEEQSNEIVLVSGNVVSYDNEEVIPVEVSGTKTLTVDIKNELEVITYNYELNIEKVKNDTANTVITNNEAIFEVSDDTQTVYVKTDALGKATYEFSMTNKEIVVGDNYTYTIKEVKAPNGYILDNTAKTVTLTFKADGSIDTMNVSGSNITKVSSTTNAANVKIVNEEEIVIVPEEFNMVINKVDEEGNSITTDTAEFTVSMPDGTKENVATNASTGKTNAINVTAPETAGTYTYVIKETKAPTGYILKEDSIIVELTYEEKDKKIVLVSGEINGESITPVETSGVKTLTIDIKNESETITYDYTLNIEKVKNDTFNTKITEDEAIFEITDGTKTTYIKTNSLGKAAYEFSMTNKEIITGTNYVYTIKEVKAPEGYMLDETPKTVILTFKADGSIDTMNVTGTNITKVTSTTNVASVKIVNEEIVIEEEPVIVPEDFNLVINKVDEEGSIITSDEAEFVLVKPDGTSVNCTTTNGVVSINGLVAPDIAGKQVYFLKETKAPQGYKILNESLVIEMEFVEDAGKIVLSNVVVKGIKEETIAPTTVSGTKTLTINVKNELEPITYDYKLNIEKVKNDTANTVITEDIAIFEMTDGENITYITTDSTGKAVYEFSMTNEEIVVGTNYTYTIKEVKAPNGYVLDNTAKTVTLTFKADGSIDTMNVTGTNITKVTSTTNVASVKIVNEEIVIEEEPVIVPEDFNLVINKVDEEGSIITSDEAEFVLVKPDGTSVNCATTNGVVSINGLVAPDVAGKQVYFIKETKAPEGYNILNESLVLEMEFVETDDKIVLTRAIIKEYEDQEITPAIVEGTKTLTINVKNEKIKEIGKYMIEVNVEDREGQPLTTGTIVLKLTNKETSEYMYKEVSVVNGKIEFDMPETEGTVTYEIEQIKAPEGYELNPNKITVEIDFENDTTNEMGLKDYTVNGTDAKKAATAQKNTASVIIINDKTPIEPIKQNYSLEINKLDKDTNALILETPTVFTVISSNAKTQECTTTNGKVTIKDLVPGDNGEEVIFVIKEKEAPEGYELLEKSVVIKVGFTEETGTIIASSTAVLLGTDIANAEMVGTTVKINVLNEKEEIEDLYVISKKDENGVDIYNVMDFYTGAHYSIENPFVDTKLAKYGEYCTVNEFINNLESNGILTVWDTSGNRMSDDSRIKTKMILKATKGEQELTFTIILKGDHDGDGRVRAKDITALKDHVMQIEGKVLTDPIALRALDVNEDDGLGRVRGNDVSRFREIIAAAE